MFLWPATILAQTNTQSDSLYQINQKVCDRFEGDMVKLAAIMEELRRRKGVTETRVAFGGVDTQIKSADYQVTFAAEALAFQRAQKFSSKSAVLKSRAFCSSPIMTGVIGVALVPMSKPLFFI